jgi:hypothetical protein
MSFKKLWAITLFTFFFCGVALSETESFLQKRPFYAHSVKIDNPETSPLAEAFLRNGISVTNLYPYFHFKTTDSGDTFIAYIHYHGPYSYSPDDFVGKFVYKKKGIGEETREFVNAFVSWMLQNAWPKR